VSKRRQRPRRKVPDNRAKQGRSARAAAKKNPDVKKSAPLLGRDASGKFIKGFSGNPQGQPVIQKEIRELARTHGPEAIARLVFWMRSADSQSSIAAAKILLDRGFGKSVQPLSSPNGGALVNITVGSEPIRTPEQLQALYSAAMRDPDLDVSNVRIELQPARQAIEHRSNDPDKESEIAVPRPLAKESQE
jgi:hypothetical protein